MIQIDIEMPKGAFDCPFMEEDWETNVPCCYLKDVANDRCYGLLADECPIKSTGDMEAEE